MMTIRNKMKLSIKHRWILGLTVVLLISSAACETLWDEHYRVTESMVDEPVWDHIRSEEKYSTFVSYMEEYGLDTLFNSGGSYTIFLPTNEAFESFNPDTGDVEILLKYHLLDYMFSMINVDDYRLLQTTTGKFAPAEYYNGEYSFSGVRISYTSPLFLDGRYYELEEIAYPLPNIYELISQHTNVLKAYIDSYDSILLDREKSKPLGFDDEGNVIYDSVYTVVNYFDSLYFPVNSETRNQSATFLRFTDEQYYLALDDMALELGADKSRSDIPEVWQNEVLLPELARTGLFPNTLQYEDLMVGRLKNVQGDSVDVDYTNIGPETRILCSNGVSYDYLDFKVPEYLYKGEVRIEGEHMIDSLGSGIFFWKPEYKVSGSTSAIAANPSSNISVGASNDSLLSLAFLAQPFEGQFKLEFYFRNVFPQKYRLVWGANFRPSGIYRIYANDVLLREFDTFNLRKTVYSVDGKSYYFPDASGNNKLDAWIEDLTEFGDIKITIEYAGKGGLSTVIPTNGLSIDFISLTPSE